MKSATALIWFAGGAFAIACTYIVKRIVLSKSFHESFHWSPDRWEHDQSTLLPVQEADCARHETNAKDLNNPKRAFGVRRR